VLSSLFLWGFMAVDEVPEPLTKAVPYLLTLIVLATASMRLRPPAHAGRPYRSGESR
jgi:simple sugar transport system permease protein